MTHQPSESSYPPPGQHASPRTYGQPPAAPRRKLGIVSIIGIATGSLVLGCCGLGAVGSALDGDDKTKTETLSASAPAVHRSPSATPDDSAVADASPSPTVTTVPTPVVTPTPEPTPTTPPAPAPERTTAKPTKKPTPKPTTARPTPKPKPKPKPTRTATASNIVHPGAYCSTAGARGVTKTGKPMVCKRTATDSRLRWRAA